MRTLVLNNYLYDMETKDLFKAIQPYSDYLVMSFKHISERHDLEENVDAIVLTESEASLVEPEGAMYADIAQMIANVERPISGICFGHQLGCVAFGAQVDSLREPVKNCYEAVAIVEPDDIFNGFQEGREVPFSQHHNDYVKRTSPEKAQLQLLAFSRSCETEAVKHRIKPFYGIQFHAEETRIGSKERKEGLRVIENFYKTCYRR